MAGANTVSRPMSSPGANTEGRRVSYPGANTVSRLMSYPGANTESRQMSYCDHRAGRTKVSVDAHWRPLSGLVRCSVAR